MEEQSVYSQALSDPAILINLGVFLKQTRLGLNKTQEDISKAAGINRTTLVQLEKGSGGTMMSFIRVLRTLDQLHLLNAFVVKKEISPLLLAEQELNKRQRAGKRRTNTSENKSNW